MLIYTVVPEEEDAESEVFPVPTDAASSGASDDGGIPSERVTDALLDVSSDTSGYEGVTVEYLCAICQQLPAHMCERCSLRVCGVC